MVQKQATQTCTCGWEMKFPEGEIKTTCPCGSVWELDLGGVWFIQLVFVPFVAKAKSKHYEKYMANRRKKAGRC